MSLTYRIEKMESFRVVGFVIHTTTENGDCMQKVPALWREVIQQGKQIELQSLMNCSPFGLIGMSVYNTVADDAKKFDYYIACASDKPVPEGMEEYIVPAATWAVFPSKSEEIHAVEVRVVTEWQPNSNYKLVNTGYETGIMSSKAPDLEIHQAGGTAEVWNAVAEK